MPYNTASAPMTRHVYGFQVARPWLLVTKSPVLYQHTKGKAHDCHLEHIEVDRSPQDTCTA